MIYSFVTELLSLPNPVVIVKCDVSGEEFVVISTISDGERKGTVIDRGYFPMDRSLFDLSTIGSRFIKWENRVLRSNLMSDHINGFDSDYRHVNLSAQR